MAKMGAPRKEISDADWEKLIRMIRIQCTQQEICDIFGMTDETLNKRIEERGEGTFSTLYEKHSSDGKMSLRRWQWAAAKKGNATMLIWLGKQVLGQRDRQTVEGPGDDGEFMITFKTVVEGE